MKSIILEAAKQFTGNDDKFQQWFHGSKVVDSSGKPLVVYHGTGTKIDKFDYEFTELGQQQLGSGFYFTTDYHVAHGYTTHRSEIDKEKPGGENSPNVLRVFLNIKKPLDAQKKGIIPKSKIKSIIEASPILSEKLEDWGDVEWEGKGVVLARAIDSHAMHQEIILQTLHKLSNDFYRGHIREFNNVVHRVLGYDGVQGKLDGETHWVAWFPEQIKSVNAKSFNPKSPYIMDCHTMKEIHGGRSEVGHGVFSTKLTRNASIKDRPYTTKNGVVIRDDINKEIMQFSNGQNLVTIELGISGWTFSVPGDWEGEEERTVEYVHLMHNNDDYFDLSDAALEYFSDLFDDEIQEVDMRYRKWEPDYD